MDRISDDETWTHDLIIPDEVTAPDGIVRPSPFAWQGPIIKAMRRVRNGKSKDVGISGRLQSLIEDGIEARADGICAKLNDPENRGYSHQGTVHKKAGDIRTFRGGLYDVQPSNRKSDVAHTDMVRTTLDGINERNRIPADEAEELCAFFDFAPRNSAEMDTLIAGTPAWKKHGRR